MSAPDHDAMPPTRWEWISLGLVLAIALAARVVGLNASLWYDEVLTLTHFIRLPTLELLQTFTSLNNHMFYSLQAQAAVALFGEQAWALRLPAMLFGMGSLVAVWVMGRAAVGRWPALLAAFLLAISYHHVWFSQNARGYTGLLFWTTVATILFVRGLRRPSYGVWTAYAVCFTAGMYTHMSAGFFFAAHGVVYAAATALSLARRDLAQSYPGLRDFRPIYGFGLSGLITLVLHLPLIAQVFTAVGRVSDSTGASAMSEWQNPLRTAQEMVISLADLGPLVPLAVAGGLLLLALGIWKILRREPLLGIVYVVQIPVTLLLLAALSFRIWPRYFFIDIGFLFLAVSAGVVVLADLGGKALARFWRSPVARHGPLAAGVTLIVAASAVLLAKNYAYPKQDFEGAVRYVQAHQGAGDVATSVGLASEPIQGYFAPSWPVVRTEGDLDAMLRNGRTVWLVTAFRSHTAQKYPQVMALVDRRFTEAVMLPGTMGDGNVRVYRSTPRTAAR
jgi:uncharacterized membrane protein